MAEEKKTNKLLITIIILLIAGMGFLGVQVNKLKGEIVQLKSAPKVSVITSQAQSGNPAKMSHSRGNSYRQLPPMRDEWDPFAEMEEIQKQMNRMFSDSFGRGFISPQFGMFDKSLAYDLQTDVQETKTHYIIKMDVPGMDKSNINVEVKNNMLMVSGQRDESSEENQGNKMFRKERSFGYFSRTVPLPTDANGTAITADYNNGVLTVKVPRTENKTAAEKPAEKITVN